MQGFLLIIYMVEIERKFLVNSTDFKAQATAKLSIAQGYLNTHPERTVRVRVQGECGYITIKGKGNQSGTTRLEWETAINVIEAKSLLALCEPGSIQKTRYLVPYKNQTFEVDVFAGDNTGLIVAEIELTHEDQVVEKPDWLGKEVTQESKYYNASLSKRPFMAWEQQSE